MEFTEIPFILKTDKSALMGKRYSGRQAMSTTELRCHPKIKIHCSRQKRISGGLTTIP